MNDTKTWSTPLAAEATQAIPCIICGSVRFASSLRCEGFSYVRCRQCGLVQMNPQPTPQAIAARYGQRHGKDYLAYELANEGAFLQLQQLGLRDIGFASEEARLFMASEASATNEKPRFLDIGCATGSLIDFLRARGWKVAGVELSAEQAAWARQNRSLDVRACRLEDADFADASFDVVHASHLVEHLNDPRSFIRTAYRVLAPDGALYLATPNIAGFQARLFGARWRSAIFDHLYLFSIRTLRRLLESEGFQVERIATWGGLAAGTAPAPLKRFADRAVKKLGWGDVMLLEARKSARA